MRRDASDGSGDRARAKATPRANSLAASAMAAGLADQERAFSLTDSLTDTACNSFISVQGWAPMVRVNSLSRRE
jgi:hypothetical protein